MIILERKAINGKVREGQLVIHHPVDYVTKRTPVSLRKGMSYISNSKQE